MKGYKRYCKEDIMDRRDFLKSAALSAAVIGVAAEVLVADRSYPVKVEPGLFEKINR